MSTTLFFVIMLALALLVIAYLSSRLLRVRGQLGAISETLADLKTGNQNRRVLTGQNDLTRQICYDINEIAMDNQSRLIRQKQSEQSYKRLMTSLSHDVKTPLSSLTGYLEALDSDLVTTEAERKEYLNIALRKARQLNFFVENLFEWVKLDAKEQSFHFETMDLNEISRSIAAGWIFTLEQNHLDYEIDIPEAEFPARLDRTAYERILNNLFTNALIHSKASRIFFKISSDQACARIEVSDNGIGISPSDLPHIFERLYQCDRSRQASGNGLGLSIVQELVAIHGGTIEVQSIPGVRTAFTITLPAL